MNNVVSSLLSRLSFGSLQRHDRMAVVPLVGSPGTLSYLTLNDAQSRNLITISEVSQSGSVPELRVENRANQAVLLLDGEELAGAKQNRVLNTTILVRRKSVTVVPVSCTEHGRWSYSTADFSESGHVMSPHLRSAKAHTVSESLQSGRRFSSDQSRVWDEIEKLHQRVGSTSPTGAMRDAHEARRTSLEKYLSAFSFAADQTGMLVFIDGVVAGMDLLSRPDTFAKIGPKLFQSYALEASAGRAAAGPALTVAAAEGFVAVAAQIKPEKYKSIGHGQDYRFLSDRLVGSALVYRNQVIHAAFFPAVAATHEYPMRGPKWRSARHRDGRVE